MNPRKVAATTLVAILSVAWLALSGPVGALDLVVESQVEEADFPNGLTLSLDFETESDVEEAYVLYTLAQEDVSSEVAAVLAEDGSSSASVVIDMETAFVPAGVDITYRWRLVGADDSEVVTPPATIIWQDDRFDWQRSSSTSVEVFDYSGGEELRAEVLASAQETVDRLSTEFSVTVDHPLRIWVYANKRDFDGTLASNSQEWAAGSAYPDLQLILAVIPENRPSELGRIIPHEVSHQLLAIATQNPYNTPATWLDEGIAVRNQTNGTSQMGRLVATAKRDGELLPLATLNSSFPFDPSEASLAYAESFSVVTYLVETYGESAIALIAAAYREGSTHDDAIRAGTGRGIAELDADWQLWVDDDVAGGVDRDDIAKVLIYGGPGLAVIAYVLVRRLRPVSPYPDEEEIAA